MEGYRNKPEIGTGDTTWQRAQQMEVAPAGYINRFLHPEHTIWL